MLSLEHLPRDEHGIIQGVWRLLHRDPEFHGTLGVDFVRGAATTPVVGRRIAGVVAVFGEDLFAEPWGDLPPDFSLPPMVRAEVSAAECSKLERCPWRSEAAAAPADGDMRSAQDAEVDLGSSDDYDALDLGQLRGVAAERGIEGAERWQAARIRKELRALDASAPTDADQPSVEA